MQREHVLSLNNTTAAIEKMRKELFWGVPVIRTF